MQPRKNVSGCIRTGVYIQPSEGMLAPPHHRVVGQKGDALAIHLRRSLIDQPPKNFGGNQEPKSRGHESRLRAHKTWREQL